MEVVKWRKSSYSGSNGGQCVELGRTPQSREILVRDSKQPNGPRLRCRPEEMAALISSIKAGQYDSEA
ncbi:DUF397 domain-containing protein [Actinomadura sp. SCN-SB]|uniref:DUF397 domain-containing protein n=1 Tax=Actinomadura sp. SCN-SB TaxID=3373092 RepID=UPI003753D34B